MIEIKPLKQCNATVTLPGSKSYTHRALIVSALAGGASVLINALQCEDTEHTVSGLREFGVPIFREEGLLRVLGKGERMERSEEEIFLGNSGTSMRFLTAMAALKRNRTCLDGNQRMCTRPMGPLLQGLNELGVRAYSRKGDGCPPVIVESQGLEGGVVRVKGEESSQFLSALLLVAPYARRDVRILVDGSLASQPYVDMKPKKHQPGDPQS